MSYGYSYRTTNRVNGKVYVGQRRSQFDPDYFGSGLQIRRAMKKYGRESFFVEILGFAENKQQLDLLEQKQVITHRSHYGRENCYNIAPGGEGVGRGAEHPMWGRRHREESCKKMSVSRSGNRNGWFGVSRCGAENPHFGKHHSEETKKRIGERLRRCCGASHGNFGKVRSPETRAKISASKKGQKRFGRKMSDEGKSRLSEARKKLFAGGFKMTYSAETRRKISDGHKRYWAVKKGEVPQSA